VQSADVLSKPFAAEDLLRKLDALLAARPAAPPPAVVEPAMPAVGPVGAGSGPAAGQDNGHHERGHNGHVERTAAPAAAGPPEASATTASGTGPILKQFAAIEGVQWAVLADREGFLLDASATGVVDAEVAGALSACLTESSEGLGRELGRGALHGMILEYAQGMVVLYSVGTSALLAIALGEPSALGKVRYFAKKSIPELLQAV
jgi:predicted regulator of Ras-like GTPase activity (Roadblock/LC7/MglB family)